MEIFSHTSHLKAHDWLLILQTAGDYMLHDLWDGHCEKLTALQDFKDCVNEVLQVSSPADEDDRDKIAALKLRVRVTLAKLERTLPLTEMPVLLHTLLHVPDSIYRWNSVRNYWAFFIERCVLNCHCLL